MPIPVFTRSPFSCNFGILNVGILTAESQADCWWIQNVCTGGTACKHVYYRISIRTGF